MLAPTFLMTARHVHPGVRTAEEYEAKQREYAVRGRAAYSNLTWRDPWVAGAATAFVSGGVWLVECACQNCPAVAPEWDAVARCYECGAVYQATMPAEAAAIEAALVARPRLHQRYWRPGFTVADLVAETARMEAT